MVYSIHLRKWRKNIKLHFRIITQAFMLAYVKTKERKKGENLPKQLGINL